MTISPNLTYAILALDSYNRGYNQGVAGLGGPGSTVPDYTIKAQSDTDDGSDGVAADFYAVAYQDASGTTVISYRGTDSAPMGDSTTDATRGWLLGGGGYFTPQTALANDFLDAVQADAPRCCG